MDQIGEFMVFASFQDWSSFEKPGFSSVMNRQWLYWASAFSLGSAYLLDFVHTILSFIFYFESMLVYRFGVRIILSLVFYFYLCQSPYRTKHAESFGYHGISSAVLASLRDRVIYYSNIGELRSERHKFKISDWASRGYTTLPSRQSYQSSSSRISPSNY